MVPKFFQDMFVVRGRPSIHEESIESGCPFHRCATIGEGCCVLTEKNCGIGYCATKVPGHCPLLKTTLTVRLRPADDN